MRRRSFPRRCSCRSSPSTARGGRIGYGKGHFDRAIAALEAKHPVLTIGLAYAVQEIDEVPLEPHDRLLDVDRHRSRAHSDQIR